MAFDDAEERTESPTPHRREEARKEGRVARSADLTSSVALLAGLVLLNLFGPEMFGRLLALMSAIGEPASARAADLPAWIERVGYGAAALLLPFLLAVLVATALAALLQTGGVVSWKPLTPKLEHLDPIKGVRRVFSMDALAKLGISLLKTVLVAAVAFATIASQIAPVLGAGQLGPRELLPVGGGIIFTLALRLGLVLLVLGLLDYFYQWWKHEKSLRMTKQEIKDELKRMDGDPLIRRRRRETQMKLAMQRLRLDVPKADVVVTNPTEFAVALRYDERTMSAPRVVAKGKDFLAHQIRKIAAEHRVPVVQRPPLARGLYHTTEVGDEVPANFYRAVAEVLAYVYQLAGRAA